MSGADEMTSGYWETKYKQRTWGGENDMHFAVAPEHEWHSLAPTQYRALIEQGLRASDNEFCRTLFARGLVWPRLRGLSILELGCGTGSLASLFLAASANCRVVAVDVSDSALTTAMRRFKEGKVADRVALLDADLRDTAALIARLKEHGPFDAIVAREVFYLLTRDEQVRLLTALRELVRPQTELLIADVSAHMSIYEDARRLFNERQESGEIWSHSADSGEDVSIRAALLSSGWEIRSVAPVSDDRVGFSYHAMARSLESTPELITTVEAYKELALLAGRPRGLQYFRAIARPARSQQNSPESRVSADGQLSVRYAGRRHWRNPALSRPIELPARKWSLLVGPSGVGKTTILRAIDQKLKNWETAGVPERRFLVHEAQPLLDSLTVELNIRLFAQGGASVEQTIRSLGLQGVSRELAGANLSSGERQRVMLAQALVSGAELILLDEPTQHLDILLRYEFFMIMRRLRDEWAASGRPSTVIWVDHSSEIARILVDHVFELTSDEFIQHL